MEKMPFDPDRVSKRRIIAEYERIQKVTQARMELLLLLAVELYRVDPWSVPFTNWSLGTEIMEWVRGKCAERYHCAQHRGLPYRAARWFIYRLLPPRAGLHKNIWPRGDAGDTK